MQNQLIETYPDIMSGTGICGHPRTSKYSVQLPREKVSYEFLDDFPTVSRDRAIAVLNSAMGSIGSLETRFLISLTRSMRRSPYSCASASTSW
ncbi:MAG: hypothetical protein EBE86_022475 [Hormoscilla sp. GUM202]|nr:hypothetical protein [Hormoscilla sp. GUM202]